MCSTPDKPEPIAPPAPPPPAPPIPILETAGDEDRKKTANGSISRGRSSLRIDRTAPAAGGIGVGLNIPK